MSGKDNTLIGPGISEALSRGSGNTVITDPSFLAGRGGIAIGLDAKADQTSVAIGARAGAGLGATKIDVRDEIVKVIAPLIAGDIAVSDDLKRSALALLQEVQRERPDRNMLQRLWASFSALATVDGVTGIAEKVSNLIGR